MVVLETHVRGPKGRWTNFHHHLLTPPPLTYPFLDSERSDECIVFTMMFIYFLFFYFFILWTKVLPERVHQFLRSKAYLLANWPEMVL